MGRMREANRKAETSAAKDRKERPFVIGFDGKPKINMGGGMHMDVGSGKLGHGHF